MSRWERFSKRIRQVLVEVKTRVSSKIAYIFDPIRGPEMIISLASTWWIISVKLAGFPANSLFRPLERVFATETWLQPIFYAIAVLLWFNLFRKVDEIRSLIFFFAVAWWVAIASLVLLDRPTSPSCAVYIAVAYLAILNYVRDLINGARL